MGSGRGKTRRAQTGKPIISLDGHAIDGVTQGTFKEKQYSWSRNYRDVKYRFQNGLWEVQRDVQVDKPFLDDLGPWIAQLQEDTAAFSDAKIDLEMTYDGDDNVERPYIIVSGWRAANTEEVSAIKASFYDD